LFFYFVPMVNFYDYIAAKAPNDAFAMLRSVAPELERPQTIEEMSALLKQFVHQGGERALRMVASIHPDRELLQTSEREYANADGAQNNYSCACGCRGAVNGGYNFYGANGAPAPAATAQNDAQWTAFAPVVMMGFFLILMAKALKEI
jgi:hypothetical protein